MLKDKAAAYYLEGGYNCAEAMLLAAREVYSLPVGEESLKLMSAFGGGMGCGRTCGALLGGLAALGPIFVEGKAHDTEGFSRRSAEYTESFTRMAGSDQCAALKPLYVREGQRCVAVVNLAAELLEARLYEAGLAPLAGEVS